MSVEQRCQVTARVYHMRRWSVVKLLSISFWPITQSGLPIQREGKSPLSFCEGSLADVSVTALSEQMLYKGGKGPKVMCCPSVPCVWFAGLSAALQEHRWLKETKRERGAANGPWRAQIRDGGCTSLHLWKKNSFWNAAMYWLNKSMLKIYLFPQNRFSLTNCSETITLTLSLHLILGVIFHMDL